MFVFVFVFVFVFFAIYAVPLVISLEQYKGPEQKDPDHGRLYLLAGVRPCLSDRYEFIYRNGFTARRDDENASGTSRMAVRVRSSAYRTSASQRDTHTRCLVPARRCAPLCARCSRTHVPRRLSIRLLYRDHDFSC